MQIDIASESKMPQEYHDRSFWCHPDEFTLNTMAAKASPDTLYYPRLFFWLPHVKDHCVKCPSCKKLTKLWLKDTKARRVYGAQDSYYVIYRRYNCKEPNCSRRELTTVDPGVVEQLPLHWQMKFPAFFTYRAENPPAPPAQ